MKKLTVVYLILFFVMLIIPAVTMPFFADAETSEKRELSEFPDITDEDGKFNDGFTGELGTYISEHIGFRTLLVEMNSAWQSALFGRSTEESVIVGSDGWIFYAETVTDFLNAATLSGRNISNIVRTLELMQDHAEENGASFVAAVIPNKNTLYPDAMPYYYISLGSDGNLELLEEALSDSDVNCADIRSAFADKDEVLYQKTDSHWDYRGALLGYGTIMEKSGFPYHKFDGVTFEARCDWAGDLAGMLYANAARPDIQYYPDYEFGYRFTSHETNAEAITLRTANESGEGVLVMFRDSFCNAMQGYFSESFAEAVFSRAYPFRMDFVGRYNADVCVLEIVERNIPNLAKRAPVMQAPYAAISASAGQMNGEAVSIFAEKSNGFIHLYGTVDSAYLGDSYRAYVLVTHGGGTDAYEAFPIFEQELLGADSLSDNGFSAYIGEKLLDGAESVMIVVSNGEAYYASTPFDAESILTEE